MNNSFGCDEVSKFSYLSKEKTWHLFNNALQTKCCYLRHRWAVHKSKGFGGVTEFVCIQVSINHSLNLLFTSLSKFSLRLGVQLT